MLSAQMVNRGTKHHYTVDGTQNRVETKPRCPESQAGGFFYLTAFIEETAML